MSRNRIVYIDGEKLKKAVNKTGMKPSVLSRILERGDKYITDCIRRGHIGEVEAVWMEQKLGISRSDYVITEEVQEKEPEEPVEAAAVGSMILVKLDTIQELMVRIIKDLEGEYRA